jgi:CBS domain containing-hemolysin-like protein
MAFLVPLLIISTLIFLNGLFVAAEFAIIAAPKTRIAQQANRGSKVAIQVLKIIKSPDLQNRYITTAQVGITIVSLGLGMYGEHVLTEWLAGILHPLESLAEPTAHTIATVAAVGLLTYLHVVIGEMIPKSLALQNSEAAVLILTRPMFIVEKLFFPLVLLLNQLGIGVTKLLRLPPPDSNAHLLTSAELEYIIGESSGRGLLERSDQLFIENILDLEERTAEQAMTPRNRICSIPADANRKRVIEIICETTKTRYPVHEGDLDKIIGVLHIKDLAREIVHNPDAETINYHKLVRPAFFIPETLPLDELLVRFRGGNSHIAILFDEYGGTSGIITLEDLIEEVVGEIQDEFDEETIPIEELSPHLLRVRGDVILDELRQLYHLDWQYEEAVTIGGLVMTELGRIPKPMDVVRYQGVKIEVAKIDGWAVEEVFIFLPES